MPELPEVETIRRQLSQRIVGKKLNNKKIVNIKRRGKMLIIGFADNSSLVFHLKLTGQLLFNAPPSRFTRKVFKFSDGSTLIFNDMIRFGWFRNVKNAEQMKEIRELGPEPLQLTIKEFRERILKKLKSKIKPLLMNQKFVAGIGNIYSDEILFKAGVRPTRQAGSLTCKEITAVFQNIKKVLRAAIGAGGSSVRHYVDLEGETGNYKKYHRVYQRTGKNCKKCGAKIKRTKLAGRSAHFCPKCQK